MATAKKLLEVAAAEIGTVGGKKYWSYFGYGYDTLAYCCVGGCYVLDKVGMGIGCWTNCGTNASNGGIQAGFKKAGWVQVAVKDMLPGDFAVCEWDGKKDSYDHLCIYECKNGSKRQTINFNVSGTTARRNYEDWQIRCAWRPPYTAEHTAAWYRYGDKWYHLTDGVLDRCKWVKSNDTWYYIGEGGYAVSNQWVQYQDKWYYCGPEGYPLTSQWKEHKNQWYYLTADGTPAVGWTQIDGKYYHFDEQAICEYDTFAEYKGEWGWLGHDGALVTDATVTFTCQADSKGVLSKIGVTIN